MFYIFLLLCICIIRILAMDDYPWTYDIDAFGGPDFWALVGRGWEMCSRGKLQSPIDISPHHLLFDPNLKPIHIDKISVMSELVNTGQMPRVRIGNSIKRPSANLTGGPLYGYRYRVQRVDIHYGMDKINGSEHTIDGRRYPMEIQILSYNTDLYNNFSDATKSPHGITGIAILVDFGPETNDELLKLTVATASVLLKNQRIELADLEPWKLLPYTRDYVTYEGSMTSPGCYESVTWNIINQPIHIHPHHYSEWGKLLQSADKGDEPQYLAPNLRKTQPFHSRLLRTNIQHKIMQRQECKISLPNISYKSNAGRKHKKRHSGHHH